MFEQKSTPGAFYSLPGNCEVFLLKGFCKGPNKWNSGDTISDESDELPSQAVMAFAWSSNKYAVLFYTDERLCIFY